MVIIRQITASLVRNPLTALMLVGFTKKALRISALQR